MNESVRHTQGFLRTIRSNGRYAFTLQDLIDGVSKSERNIRKDLDRLSQKKEIINIRRGFYTILPPEYQHIGVLPVEFYIHELMESLHKPYYVGLFSAAMFHGAAHQQPQEFYIIAQAPKPRKIEHNNLIINFTEKKNFPLFGIEEKKTDTGYFKIASKELTFLDLIYFEQSMGGYNRISTIIEELMDEIDPHKMELVMQNDFPTSVFQRAGYIAEKFLLNEKLAVLIEKKVNSLKPTYTALKSAVKPFGDRDERWKIIVNINMESDL